MTLTIIYLSGVIFFLIQAHKYARICRQRIIGALTWPVLIPLIPYYVMRCRGKMRDAEARLRYDESVGLDNFRVGGDGKDYRWGIGA